VTVGAPGDRGDDARPGGRAVPGRPRHRRCRARGRDRVAPRRRRAVVPGGHRSRGRAVLRTLAQCRSAHVHGGGCPDQSARPHPAAGRRLRRCIPGRELRPPAGGRLGHRPPLAGLVHAPRLGRGAPATDHAPVAALRAHPHLRRRGRHRDRRAGRGPRHRVEHAARPGPRRAPTPAAGRAGRPVGPTRAPDAGGLGGGARHHGPGLRPGGRGRRSIARRFLCPRRSHGSAPQAAVPRPTSASRS